MKQFRAQTSTKKRQAWLLQREFAPIKWWGGDPLKAARNLYCP